MALKVIVIAGEPATGKTTLVQKTFNPQGLPKTFKFGRLRGHTDGRIFVGGVYDGSLFQGTDKLSMAVQPDAVDFVRNQPEGVLVMEGDRVANPKFLSALDGLKCECHLVFLRAPDTLLHERHQSRGDKQNPRWLKSRATKNENLLRAAKTMPHVNVIELVNETPACLTKHANTLAVLAM